MYSLALTLKSCRAALTPAPLIVYNKRHSPRQKPRLFPVMRL